MEPVTVSQINKYIATIFSSDNILRNVWIKGEISNFKLHTSGHCYMTLKDDASSIRAVMFRSKAINLKFVPEAGMKVIANGYISVYERDGACQLYIDSLSVDGIGDLQKAYEQLKLKLEKEGLFDNNKKKQIPKFPKTIGVVTSPTGAALRDIINVTKRRYSNTELLILPVLVQGEDSARQIASAINYANENNLCDVLIVGRGGGSIEDLWSFNDESVAYAVFNSNIPVISAVGHETDFTIIDFVSDLRAPTPSAAAEIAVPNEIELRNNISLINKRMFNQIYNKISNYRSVIKKLSLKSPVNQINQYKITLDLKTSLINRNAEKILVEKKSEFLNILSKYKTLNPINVLERGYSQTIVNNKPVTSIKQTKIDDNITVTLTDGNIECCVNKIIER